MGYSSTFNLVITGANGQPDHTLETHVIIEELREYSDGANYCLCKDGTPNDSGKWYDAREEVKEFSKRYPTALFKLEVEGEENDDLWHYYALNGKSQECAAIITYPPYDASKLK